MIRGIICLFLLQVSISGLEKALHQYTLSPCDEPFDMSSVPVASIVDETKNKQVSDPLFLTPGNHDVPGGCAQCNFEY